MWVAPAKDFCEDFERRESIYVLWTAIPTAKTIGWGAVAYTSSQERNPKPINEGTKLN